MKLNYTNILLFSLSLNILSLSPQVYNKRNHKRNTTSRILCECESYAPANYGNDPEMKAVMQDFDRQTSQRFGEYNERMIKNRQKCKEQCEKDIQKIILKDKIEKELAEKFVTLETNINTNDISTCVFEKSMADKVEKTCSNCEGIMGMAIPGWGILGSIGFYGFVNANAMDASVKAGIAKVLSILEGEYVLETLLNEKLASLVTPETYACPNALYKSIMAAKEAVCGSGLQRGPCIPTFFRANEIGSKVHSATVEGIEAAKDAGTNIWNNALSASSFYSDPIVISSIVVVCIALILFVIYLILRYRRKKK